MTLVSGETARPRSVRVDGVGAPEARQLGLALAAAVTAVSLREQDNRIRGDLRCLRPR